MLKGQNLIRTHQDVKVFDPGSSKQTNGTKSSERTSINTHTHTHKSDGLFRKKRALHFGGVATSAPNKFDLLGEMKQSASISHKWLVFGKF